MKQNNTKIENKSIVLIRTITAAKLIVTLIIKVTVVMINMITKIRMIITISEKQQQQWQHDSHSND